MLGLKLNHISKRGTWCWNRNIAGNLYQHHCCWCHGSLRRQVMSNHNIEYVQFVSTMDKCQQFKFLFSLIDVGGKYNSVISRQNSARKFLIPTNTYGLLFPHAWGHITYHVLGVYDIDWERIPIQIYTACVLVHLLWGWSNPRQVFITIPRVPNQIPDHSAFYEAFGCQ